MLNLTKSIRCYCNVIVVSALVFVQTASQTTAQLHILPGTELSGSEQIVLPKPIPTIVYAKTNTPIQGKEYINAPVQGQTITPASKPNQQHAPRAVAKPSKKATTIKPPIHLSQAQAKTNHRLAWQNNHSNNSQWGNVHGSIAAVVSNPQQKIKTTLAATASAVNQPSTNLQSQPTLAQQYARFSYQLLPQLHNLPPPMLG